MDRTEDHHIKRRKPDSEEQRSHIFPHMWKVDLKDKYIHNTCIILHTHAHTHTHTQRERERGRKRGREHDCNNGSV
jgi:hypothetical protein